MLVDELVPQGCVGYITGREGTCKTFLALDLAMHLIAGKRAWNGREVTPSGLGRVLFVAGEGARSFPKRIDAWLEHHDVAALAGAAGSSADSRRAASRADARGARVM